MLARSAFVRSPSASEVSRSIRWRTSRTPPSTSGASDVSCSMPSRPRSSGETLDVQCRCRSTGLELGGGHEPLEQIGQGHLAVAGRPPVDQAPEHGAHRSGKARVALGQGGAHVRRIPSEQLVRALADERELHVPRRPAGEQGRGHPGRIGERLAHDADELRDALLERLRRDGDRGPVEPEVSSDLLGEDALVVGGLREAERVGPEPAAGREALRDRRDEGGIQPPAQEHAALDLRVGLAADGLPEDLVERVDRRGPVSGPS